MEPLTKVQKELYDWLVAYIQRHNYGPSTREMLEAMGLSANAAIQSRLEYLKAKGYIDWEKGMARTIRLLVSPIQPVWISNEAAAIADSLIEPGEGRTEVVQRAICLYQQFAELDEVQEQEADDLTRTFMGMDDDEPLRGAEVIELGPYKLHWTPRGIQIEAPVTAADKAWADGVLDCVTEVLP